jgi:group I intron endonuclease
MKTTTTPCIYRIQNLVNRKMYIGSTVNPESRWKSHQTCLRNGTHNSRYLQHAWGKYGEEAFVFEVLEYTGEARLIVREQFWLDLLKTYEAGYGYNIQRTAGTRPGHKLTSEQLSQRRRAQYAHWMENGGRQWVKVYTKSNHERIKMQGRARYRTGGAERRRQWCEDNRDQYNATMKTWRDNNKDRTREIDRRYRENNLDEINKRERERRAANPPKNETVRKAFYKAVKQGKAVQPDKCLVCAGTENISIYHPSVEPQHSLTVIGLCRSCRTNMAHGKQYPAVHMAIARMGI